MVEKNGNGSVEAEAFDFFASAETFTIYPISGNTRLWVRIKRELTFGEQSELDNAATSGYSVRELKKAAEQGSEVVIHSDIKRHRLIKLALYVDDWNLPGPDGATIRWPRKLDERVALLERMSDRLGKLLSNEVDRLLGEQAAAREAEGYPLATDEGEDEKPNPSTPRVLEGRAR